MAEFYKRNTLIRTICFMAFFVAINVICSFLTNTLPLVSIILIIFLPLTSAVVEVNCKDRWFPIYAFATIGLSIVVTLSSIDFTLFYVVPSIFTGYIFGLFAKKHLPSMYAIFFASIIQTILSFAFIPVIQLITEKNLIDVFVEIFRISDVFWFKTLLLFIFFAVSLIQTILSYIVVENELKKFTHESTWKIYQDNVACFSSLGATILSIIFGFFYMPVALLMVAISIYFAIFVVIAEVYAKNKLALIVDGVSLFLSLLLYALLNRFFSGGSEFILLVIAPTLISLFSISYSFLKKHKQ